KGKRGKGKGEREKVSNTCFTPYALTLSQTTREVHTAYPNRTGEQGSRGDKFFPSAPCPMPHAQ
ncbi:hypothetical protein, partial [Nostoc linckia]|uniref:hypothetical protein n=2 Tax=Nostoc linckia TaxID=92942 RepID=UPI001C558AAA